MRETRVGEQRPPELQGDQADGVDAHVQKDRSNLLDVLKPQKQLYRVVWADYLYDVCVL